jgi:hypothetical protein
MTPRSNLKMKLAAVLLLGAAGLAVVSGCDPRSLAYFLQPNESSIPATAPSLEGKRVLILCNVTSGSLAEFPSLERDLPKDLAAILRTKVKKITVIEPDKVATWVEAHPHWTDPADAARDFDADIAIRLEVEQFRSQTPGDLNMVHGEAKVHITVFEMQYPKNSKDKPIKDQPKEAHEVYDEYAETTFPDRGPLPIDTGTSVARFTHTFLKIVVKEVSWHFVPHREEDSIQNSRIEK